MFLCLTNEIKSNKHIKSINSLILEDQGNFYLQKLVCPHQGAKLNNTGNMLLCPYHGWSFDLLGNPVGSGTTECKNKNNLPRKKLFPIGSFLFDKNFEIENFEFLKNDHLVLVDYRTEFVKSQPEIVMDVFLDVDHIPVAHSRVYDQLGIFKDVRVSWEFGKNYSLQTVDTDHRNLHIEEQKDIGYGAAWLALYPGTMIEWQPGAFFITQTKQAPEGCSVEIWQYKDRRYSEATWKINLSIWEQAWAQDKMLAESIELLPKENLETAKKHFRKWLEDK